MDYVKMHLEIAYSDAMYKCMYSTAKLIEVALEALNDECPDIVDHSKIVIGKNVINFPTENGQ